VKKAHVAGAGRPFVERLAILITEETLAMNQPWRKKMPTMIKAATQLSRLLQQAGQAGTLDLKVLG